MGRVDDIAKLFQKLGASTDAYLEVDHSFDYDEPATAPLRSVPAAVPVRSMVETRPVSSVQRLGAAEVVEVLPAHAPVRVSGADTQVQRSVSAPLRSLLAEVVQAREAEALARNHEALEQSLLKGAPPALQAQVIAVVSAKGGVGKSTLCAALAGSLTSLGGRRISIELDAQDCLRHHLHASPDVAGLAQGSLRGEPWGDLLLPGAGGIEVLPHGPLSAGERTTLEQFLDHDRHWLARQLARLSLDARDVVVLDVACGPSRYLEQALDVANHVLVVLDTEAAGYLTLDAVQAWLEPLTRRPLPPSCSYVINRLDPSRAFSVDMHEVLRRRLGEQLLGQVRLDYAIAEALAYGIDPLQAAVPTPGVQDLLELGNRVMLLLSTSAQGLCRS